MLVKVNRLIIVRALISAVNIRIRSIRTLFHRELGYLKTCTQWIPTPLQWLERTTYGGTSDSIPQGWKVVLSVQWGWR